RATNTGRLRRRAAAKAEVMQFKIDEIWITRFFKILADDVLHRPALRGNRCGVPHFGEQCLEVIGKPWYVRVGVLDGHKDIRDRDVSAFGNSVDAYWQPSVVFFQNVTPARFVEEILSEVCRKHFFCLGDFFLSDHLSCEILFNEVLQAEK